MLDDCGWSPNQIWRMYARREEKLERGSGSILLQEIFQVRVPEMTFPAFLLDIFTESTRRKMLLGEQRRAYFQFFSPITFLAVRFWNNIKRMKEILTQRHQ